MARAPSPPTQFTLSPAPAPRPRGRAGERRPRLHRSVNRLLGDLACLPDLTGRWPETLRFLVDTAEAALRDAPDPDPRAQAQRVVAAIAAYVGGGKLHLPPVAIVERALRDARIWRDHQARPWGVAHLVERYGLSKNQIYVILRIQMELHRRPLPGPKPGRLG